MGRCPGYTRQLAEKTANPKEETGLVPGLVAFWWGTPCQPSLRSQQGNGQLAAGFCSEVVRSSRDHYPSGIVRLDCQEVAHENEPRLAVPSCHGIYEPVKQN